MLYRKLGSTDQEVSVICLGTMTWGEQNTKAQAHDQMSFARERGVNFFDAAEMYPVPPKAQTQGRTEEYIGHWFKANPAERNQVVLASKVAGPSESMGAYLREGSLRLDRRNMETALHQSLKRMQTDYIDLYQLHWPERYVNNFGQLGYESKPDPEDCVPLAETLEVLNDFVVQGKVRHIGVCNETPWGVTHALKIAEQNNWQKLVSVQNPYSLLNRSYEIGLAEISLREQCGLLAYSPLGFGVLTGKYRHGAKPEGARLTLFDRFQRYLNPQAQMATELYLTLADDFSVSPTQLALAYVNTRSFVSSNIIGATTLAQLAENIDSINFKLTDEMMQRIEAIHQVSSNPAP